MKPPIEDYNQNELRAAKMQEEKEWVDRWTEYIQEEKKQHRWYRKLWRKYKIKSGYACPMCFNRLDYDHIGYKGDRAYCHSCGYRSDGENKK